MKIDGYKLHQELRFEVCGEEFSVTRTGEDAAEIEEMRKNGQEDCHMSGELTLRDGRWDWADKWSRKQFQTYGNVGVVDAIIAHVNKYPPPMLGE